VILQSIRLMTIKFTGNKLTDRFTVFLEMEEEEQQIEFLEPLLADMPQERTKSVWWKERQEAAFLKQTNGQVPQGFRLPTTQLLIDAISTVTCFPHQVLNLVEEYILPARPVAMCNDLTIQEQQRFLNDLVSDTKWKSWMH